jgi:hypothetical protein
MLSKDLLPMDSVEAEFSFPSGEELLQLERRSRKLGSGIDASSLCASWWLDQLWGRRQARSLQRPAALMRALAACLEISIESERLIIRNSVSLGSISICFCGHGQLEGKRPLLKFSFDRLQMRWGERLLLERSLPQPTAQKMPFFALISLERQPKEGWLAARGRGGGLALWRLKPAAVHD